MSGAGLSYAELGATHHSCEDIALMRVLPNMTVICPGDAVEVRLALSAAFKQGGPVYIRLGKRMNRLFIRRSQTSGLAEGFSSAKETDRYASSAPGNVLPVVMETADLLAIQGIEAQVVSMHTVKPLDKELLKKVFRTFKIVATVEEHSLIGGLGGSVAEWLSGESSTKADLLRFGVKDEFIHGVGKQRTARQSVGIDAEIIPEKILKRDEDNSYHHGRQHKECLWIFLSASILTIRSFPMIGYFIEIARQSKLIPLIFLPGKTLSVTT